MSTNMNASTSHFTRSKTTLPTISAKGAVGFHIRMMFIPKFIRLYVTAIASQMLM